MLERLKLEEGWSTLFLVWAMVFVGALAIREADLISGLGVLTTISTGAVVSGLLLAKSNFSGRRAHLFSLIYGLALAAYLIGLQLPADLTWQERVFDLVNRQAVWIGKVFSDEASRDGLIFTMHTSGVYWLLGYSAAWYTFRNPKVWRVVLPSGLVLMSVIYYYFGPANLAIYLAIYVLIALIYIARTYLVSEEKRWRASAIRYEEGIRFNFVRASILAAAIALGIAWTLPALPANAAVGEALSDVSSPWRAFQDDWTRLFAALRSYNVGSSDFYGDSLTLGGPRNVSDDPIMDVFVDQQLPAAYWHGMALNYYNDGRWTLEGDPNKNLHFPDDGLLNVPLVKERELVTQTVFNYVPNAGLIYGAPDLLGSDQQMSVTEFLTPEGERLVAGIRSRYVLRQGDVYEVQSSVSVAPADALRAASTDYPDWVETDYLQVPEGITPETKELARRLTEPFSNPFDQTIAVRNYLRESITYNDQAPSPPDDVEPVHYVLFQSQEGYCNYYASAMVMMMRSVGVPARFVQGYAAGEFNETDNFYRVRASDSHTWVEVYFPEYGWIQFEPTASRPTVSRNDAGAGGDAFDLAPETGDLMSPDEELSPAELRDLQEQSRDSSADQAPAADADGLPFVTLSANFWQFALGAALLGMAFVSFRVVDRANRRVEGNVVRSYDRLANWGKWLGISFRPANTPYERADMLADAVPEGAEPIRNLMHQYVLVKFSPRSVTEPFFNAIQQWRQLRPVLWRRAVRVRWEQLRARLPGKRSAS